MPISVSCRGCHAQFRVDDLHAGKKIRCPHCKEAVSVPAAVAPEPVMETAPRKETRPSRPANAGTLPGRTSSVFEAPQKPVRPLPAAPTEASSIVPVVMGIGGVLAVVAVIAIIAMKWNDPGSSEQVQASNDSKTTPAISSTLPSDASAPLTDGVPVVASSGTPSAAGIPSTSSLPANPVASPSIPGSTAQPGVTNAASVPPGTSGSTSSATPATTTPPSVATANGNVPMTLPSAADSSGTTPAGIEASTPTPLGNPTPAVDQTGYITASLTELSVAEIFQRVKPAVVRVNVRMLDGVGHGSGFVINPSGIVVTNYHVIGGGTKAWVEFANEDTVEVDGILYMSPEKDIAILKFDPAKAKVRPVAIPLAKSLPVQGTKVAAIGAPLGLDMTVTEGVCGSTRTAEALEKEIGLQGHEGVWVQTDAEISPGNSGGPLINMKGEVLAINTLSYTKDGAQGLNFGISCDDIREGMNELEETPIVLSPLVAPPRDITNELDEERQGEVLDVSDTEDGRKRLAALKKLEVVYLASRTDDPLRVVAGAVRTEVSNVLERLKIEESLISNDKAVLVLATKLNRDGDRRSLYITAHIIVIDESTGGQQPLKLWERTGNAGSTNMQALLSGKVSANFRKDLKEFFGKMHKDVTDARKTANSSSGASASESSKDAKDE